MTAGPSDELDQQQRPAKSLKTRCEDGMSGVAGTFWQSPTRPLERAKGCLGSHPVHADNKDCVNAGKCYEKHLASVKTHSGPDIVSREPDGSDGVFEKNDIGVDRRLLGHANITTIQRYVHLDDRELADAQDLVE
jgi:hypothetical protein